MEKFVLILLPVFVCQLSILIEGQTFENYSCVEKNLSYTQGTKFQENLPLVITNLTSKSSSSKFYNYSIRTFSISVYGLYQCRNDLSLDVCGSCVEDAARRVMDDCPPGEGIIWYRECMLRFADRNIFSLFETSPVYHFRSTENVTNYDMFTLALANVTRHVLERAAYAMPHFALVVTNFTMSDRLYCYAQCTSDVDFPSCSNCLSTALREMTQCCDGSQAVSVMMPSCQLTYDASTAGYLINIPAVPPRPISYSYGSPVSPRAIILAVVLSCGSLVLIAVAVVLWLRCRKKHNEASVIAPPTSHSQPTNDSRNLVMETDFLQYDFATLRIATEDFSEENKLGEGGFGTVYKGALENQAQVAIKRLSGTSGQGTKEFMTEVGVLAKLQHKNLVKLVGFCSDGDEKLLVYEFMSNASLDRFLFDSDRRHLLNWATRYKIIMGIARGVQYLHEDSRLTVIHRDLKPSNILLDMEMNPKIADFGLAKLFEGAQTFGNSSRISGTLGYMAPEYMETGKYSEKSDVYSFGIVLLEIVSGLNNKRFYQSQRKLDLAFHAWKLWNEKRTLELMDPALLDECPSSDVMRCIQIALLCLQENASQRPTMTFVAFMLTASVNLPVPYAPAMSFPQFSLPTAYSSEQQSGIHQPSTMSHATEISYPGPR